MGRVWNRLAVFGLSVIGKPNTVASLRRATVARWRKAFAADPELAADLIRLGGILALTPPARSAAETHPEQLAYEAGRRDFAAELLAIGQITPWELKQMMENDDER